MKKILVILLLLVYGGSTSGMTLYFHYCCGQLKNIDLTPVEHKGCGQHSQMDKQSCCQSQSLELKVKSEHKSEPSFSPLYKCSILPAEEVFVTPSIANFHTVPKAGLPPPLLVSSLFILHCVFRI
jgi:hypothetical protein